MGHEISAKGIRPIKEHVKALEQAEEPRISRNVNEVRSFLGLGNYSARYIHKIRNHR